ncbi:sulfate transporter-like [Haliotis rubra]|uniref:sulfate transporter-like n=1 Tax=Haliotis rubra TaxID=36100 RepID=UPI001EE5C504|nr:sulfate transporter-like [Haliotis rubra]
MTVESGNGDEGTALQSWNTDEDGNDRKFVKVVDFEEAFRNTPETPTVRERLKNWTAKKCTSRSFKKSVSRNLPFIKMFKNYKLKQDLPSDFVAGITVGIMMIPQGMAFGKLSTLTPVVGLYISLFAPLTYFFVGTGRQVSMGCIAVLSLMMASILEKYDASVEASNPIASLGVDPVTHCPQTQEFSDTDMAKRIEVAGAVTLATGLVTMLAGKLGLGFVINFMSNALITGFTVGVSIHVCTSQIKNIFGLGYAQRGSVLPTPSPLNYSVTNMSLTNMSLVGMTGLSLNNCTSTSVVDLQKQYAVLTRYNGSFKIILTWVDILKHITATNVATLIISLICMLIIYLVKAQINERFKDKMKIPIPIELIVVILGTLASYFLRLQETYNVPVVGKIPGGVPVPRVPNILLAKDYFFEALIIIIVAYAQTISMAKTLGMKNNYKVDAHAEMFATGSASVVCALFSGYITAASVSRSLVQDGAGGRTQVTSLVACCVVLLVIMVLGPYLHALPLCVLSSIIIVNLRGMFMKLFQLRELWRKSHYDCIVWVFTFCASVILDADKGLMIGFLVCTLMVVVRTQRSTTTAVGTVSSSEEYRSLGQYRDVKEMSGVRVIRMDSPLYFANADIFKKKVYKLSGVNPLKRRKKTKEIVVDKEEEETNHVGNNYRERPIGGDGDAATNDANNADSAPDTAIYLLPGSKDLKSSLHHIVIDMTGVTFLDIMGVTAIQQIIAEYKSINVEVFLSEVREASLGILESTGFMKKFGDLLYLTCDDAVYQAVSSPGPTKDVL